MPKRKNEGNYDKLLRKIRKIEKKLRKRRRSRSQSSSQYTASESPNHSEVQEQDHVACEENTVSNDADVLDYSIDYGLDSHDIEVVHNTGHVDKHSAKPTKTSAMISTSAVATTEATMEPSNITTLNDHLVNSVSNDLTGESTLDSAILEIFGDDPTVPNTFGPEIQQDLAVRLEHFATHGLTKETRKEITEKYLVPSNGKLINAPVLNAEIKAAITDVHAKRDKSIELRQKKVAVAITCLSQAMSRHIANSSSDPELIKILMDAAKILCDSQYNDSATRRNFILSSMKKDMKDQLQNTKTDELLFGQNLTETIKMAKAINKSGAELKTPAPKSQPFNRKPTQNTTAGPSRNLNWKGPFPPRKQPNHPRMKEPHQSKKRPPSSSRHSQHQSTSRR